MLPRVDPPRADPIGDQVRAREMAARQMNDARRPGPEPMFWRGVAFGLPLTAAIWIVLALVFRH